MIKNNTFLTLFICLNFCFSTAQDRYERNDSADIEHYRFSLFLNDTTNAIKGEAEITVNFKQGVEPFALDLIGKGETYGMEITKISEGSIKANYNFSDHKIKITPLNQGGTTRSYTIHYEGIPERGLVIDTTKFGQRSFFGDNWPNLARHWLPSVDHPYDKASVEFKVTAPAHYDVVATGKKIEESALGNGYKLTTYSESAPVAMKGMTIGVTHFATKLLGYSGTIPVTAWVYPENRLDGFSDYAVAVDILNYFVDNIGPYAYEKLANMQAKTQWGGLENAGTISYFENSVNGKNQVEGLIAHEIAHQWFGNSATENSWNHVWLSEGFATYFAILYQEQRYGNDKRKEELRLDRKQIHSYYDTNPSPIVDNTIIDPLKVLSPNTYQKGGWVLNMLRHRLGDETFWKGIRAYYKTYENANALTQDFRAVMETVSGENLEDFFQQWLFTKGYPEISWKWSYRKGKITVSIQQKQSHALFHFPLEIGITQGGKTEIKKIQINSKQQSFEFSASQKPDSLELDPEVWLLFQEK
ncbi:M1 family metallopeptidase [Spongiimicrobium salis]|uniref:M1 family metallopeptidase n=1 Tax=Spongiimicrobium salis TaxID=1667022 RepID=UPI00374D92B5